MFGKPLLTAIGAVVVVWIAAIATSHTFGGWIHLLPAAVLLGIAGRVVYRLFTLD